MRSLLPAKRTLHCMVAARISLESPCPGPGWTGVPESKISNIDRHAATLAHAALDQGWSQFTNTWDYTQRERTRQRLASSAERTTLGKAGGQPA